MLGGSVRRVSDVRYDLIVSASGGKEMSCGMRETGDNIYAYFVAHRALRKKISKQRIADYITKPLVQWRGLV